MSTIPLSCDQKYALPPHVPTTSSRLLTPYAAQYPPVANGGRAVTVPVGDQTAARYAPAASRAQPTAVPASLMSYATYSFPLVRAARTVSAPLRSQRAAREPLMKSHTCPTASPELLIAVASPKAPAGIESHTRPAVGVHRNGSS